MNERSVTPAEMPKSQEATPEEKQPLSTEEMIRQAVAQAVAEEKKAWKAPALSREEMEKQQLDEREAALLAREQALAEREMRSFAREQLAQRKLPEALLDALCCKDEESCLNSLNQVEKAFRAAVQEGVVERMRGEEPLRSDAAPLDTMDDEAYYHATYVK